jgi:hypothetical protein
MVHVSYPDLAAGRIQILDPVPRHIDPGLQAKLDRYELAGFR